MATADEGVATGGMLDPAQGAATADEAIGGFPLLHVDHAQLIGLLWGEAHVEYTSTAMGVEQEAALRDCQYHGACRVEVCDDAQTQDSILNGCPVDKVRCGIRFSENGDEM